MKITIEVELEIVTLDSGIALPVLSLYFEGPNSEDAIEMFDPERLYLRVEPDPMVYGLVDEAGHRYCGVEHSDNWISTAGNLGGFLLTLRTRVPSGHFLARIVLVHYPFGALVLDSGIFPSKDQDLTEALGRGSRFQREVPKIAQRLHDSIPTVN